MLYRLNDGTRIFKAQQVKINDKQRVELLEVQNQDTKADNFKLILKKVGFNYIGTPQKFDEIFMNIDNTAKNAEIINTYGWQPESKMYVFSDCAIGNNQILKPNSIGIIENSTGTQFYLPTASPANKNNPEMEELKNFVYKAGTLNFKDFALLFYNSNELNGSIGIMYYLLSLFRDIVFLHLDFFPYLFLFGTAGGGKTSYAEILISLFGDYSKGLDVKNITKASISRIASQKRNTITYYKEYKKDVEDYIEQYFKSGYDGVSRTISTGVAKNTITFKIESAGMLDSNFLPTNDESVFSRMIILDFDNSSFTDKQRTAFLEIKNHKETGLVQITKEVLQNRTLFEDNFKDVYYFVLDTLKNGKMKDFKDRERAIKHVALILTPFHILNGVLSFPFDIETLENIIINHAEKQYEKLNEFKSTGVFWQAMAYYKSENKIKEYIETNDRTKAYYFKDVQKKTLYIKSTKFDELHTLYCEYCRKKQIPQSSLPEIRNALLTKGYKPYIENPQKGKKVFNQTYIGSSYAFQYSINDNGNLIIDNLELEL